MRIRASYLIYAIVLLMAVIGCHSYPELVMTGMNAPTAERCGECHIAIYDEWKQSLHARSFINPEFKEATNDYEFTLCLGCHIPETIYTETDVKPRNYNLKDGVHCNGCHLDGDCALSGPLPALAPHPVGRGREFYRTSDLCGKCHKGVFEEWKAVKIKEGEKKTCQECHMPSVERKLIQDEPWQKIYPVKKGRKHTFAVNDAIAASSDLIKLEFRDVALIGKQVKGVLLIENTSILHHIPTGDYGYREAIITIELFDSLGLKLASNEQSCFVELDSSLKQGEARLIPFSFDLNKDVKLSLLVVKLIRANFDRSVYHILGEKRMELRS